MLNAQLKAWLDRLNELVAEQKAAGVEATPATVRDSMAAMTRNQVRPGPELPWVGDARVECGETPVPVRLYDPAPDRDTPVCLFFHGGGHMAGSVAVYDPICRRLADASGWLVVSVDYRLAPEYPYPFGLEDCHSVARHLWPVLDDQGRRYQRRLALAGDSGGGTFAATLSALAQNDQRLPVEKQVLIYPSLDYTLNHPSVTENGQGYLLEAERIAWYFQHYFQHGEDRRGASPLFMPVSNRLPETLVISAEYCPLRDEALAYVQRLNDTGVPCRHRHFDDMIHAYLNLESLAPDACAATYREIAAFLNGD